MKFLLILITLLLGNGVTSAQSWRDESNFTKLTNNAINELRASFSLEQRKALSEIVLDIMFARRAFDRQTCVWGYTNELAFIAAWHSAYGELNRVLSEPGVLDTLPLDQNPSSSQIREMYSALANNYREFSKFLDFLQISNNTLQSMTPEQIIVQQFQFAALIAAANPALFHNMVDVWSVAVPLSNGPAHTDRIDYIDSCNRNRSKNLQDS